MAYTYDWMGEFEKSIEAIDTEEISKNIEQVSAITKETATGAEQSAAAADQLSKQAEGMKAMVGQFKMKA